MDNLKEVIESILFVAGESVELNEIADKLNISVSDVNFAVKELQKEKDIHNNGVQLQIFNGKAQLCSNPKYTQFVTEVLNPIKEKALTKSVLEAASIVAYKQPITRLEIEQVRGVNSDYAINILIENNLIEVVGRKDAIGKPLLYGTTDIFLKRFNIESLDKLPDYNELIDRLKVINTNNMLFDYSNMPSAQKESEDESVGDNESVSEDENVETDNESISDDEGDNEEINNKTEIVLEKETIIFESVASDEDNGVLQKNSIDTDSINKFFSQIKTEMFDDDDVSVQINKNSASAEEIINKLSDKIIDDEDISDLI